MKDETPQRAPERGLAGGRFSLIMALGPGVLLAGVAGGIAFPILPIAGVRAGLSLPFIGLLLAANRAVRVVSSPFVGALADRFGGKGTLLAGLGCTVLVMGLYALGIVSGFVGPLFLAGRLLHGLGSACVFVSAQALALHGGGSTNSGRAAGTVRAAMVLGVPIGLTAGGLLSDRFGDAAAFEMAGAATVAALLAAWTRVPDLRAKISVRPPIKETLREMSDRRLLGVGALNFVLNFTGGGMVLTTLALLVHHRHIAVFARNEQGTAGLLMGIMSILDAATTPLFGRIGDRFRAHARVAAVSLVTLIPGLLCLGLSSGVWPLAAGLGIIGIGAAGLGPSLLALLGEWVPRERRGTGAGLLQLCGDLGGMLGPLVGTALFAGNLAIPYVGTAALVACFTPIALWLARLEQRAVLSR